MRDKNRDNLLVNTLIPNILVKYQLGLTNIQLILIDTLI